MITPELALRIRQRGLLLPISGTYTTERLKEIAILQNYLMRQMELLDEELKQMGETNE
jgi:hypothetical protein